ncbi:Acetyltransferase (GNAT) family protein [compost metagenome]
MEAITITKDQFSISTDKTQLDLDAIHAFLSKEAYWSLHIPKQTVETAVKNSLCFGVFHGERQIGFARVISDFSTIAYLGDVYILEEFRGNGLSKWLMETIMTFPALQGLRRWILLTGDAHGLYRQYGWTDISDPTKWMELHNKNVYQSETGA